MNWNKLDEIEQLTNLIKESENQPVMIFKHSTSCSISAAALGRMERSWADEEAKGIKPYYLDLIKNRSISNAIISEFGVEHESPQVILIKNGKSVYSESHFGISFQEIISAV